MTKSAKVHTLGIGLIVPKRIENALRRIAKDETRSLSNLVSLMVVQTIEERFAAEAEARAELKEASA